MRRRNFYAVNDNLKPVLALYLTPATMDGQFISDILRDGGNGWGNFVLQAVTQNQIPAEFPLRISRRTISSGMFSADRQRWKNSQP